MGRWRILLHAHSIPTSFRPNPEGKTFQELSAPACPYLQTDMFLIMLASSKKLARSSFDLIVVARYGALYV